MVFNTQSPTELSVPLVCPFPIAIGNFGYVRFSCLFFVTKMLQSFFLFYYQSIVYYSGMCYLQRNIYLIKENFP